MQIILYNNNAIIYNKYKEGKIRQGNKITLSISHLLSEQQTPGVEGAGLDKSLEQAVQRAQHVVTRPGRGTVITCLGLMEFQKC